MGPEDLQIWEVVNIKSSLLMPELSTRINFGTTSASSYYTSCENGGEYKTVMDIVTYFMLAANLIAFLASIVFLFGIIRNIPDTAIIFMYALALSLLVNLVFIVLAILFSILDPNCSRYTSIIMPAISFLVWLYFIIVINSYEEQMLD